MAVCPHWSIHWPRSVPTANHASWASPAVAQTGSAAERPRPLPHFTPIPLNGGDFDTQSYNKSTKTAGSHVKTDLPRYPETRLLRRIQHVTRFNPESGLESWFSLTQNFDPIYFRALLMRRKGDDQDTVAHRDVGKAFDQRGIFAASLRKNIQVG